MNEFASNFHFIRPAMLLLAPLAIGLWWLWQRRSDPLRGWREQIQPELLGALIEGSESSRRGPAGVAIIAWLLAVIAIAGPTWRLEPSPFSDDTTPLMILMKADISMDTPDPAPSRLERAHLKVADLAGARKGQPLGLIAYAGSAHLVLPPTRDTEVVAQMAAEISPGIMPVPGDRLDLALREAERILDQGQKGGSVVVVADTVDTDPAQLESVVGDFSYRIQIFAIASSDSSQIETLRATARRLKATVVPLAIENDDIEAIVRRAAGVPVAQSGNGEQGERWEEAGYWLAPLLGLMFLMTFRRERKEEEVSA